jgi:hypothetical protein
MVHHIESNFSDTCIIEPLRCSGGHVNMTTSKLRKKRSNVKGHHVQAYHAFVVQGEVPEVFTFDEFLQLAPRRFSEADLLSALDGSGKAVLVQGCWVSHMARRFAAFRFMARIREGSVAQNCRPFQGPCYNLNDPPDIEQATCYLFQGLKGKFDLSSRFGSNLDGCNVGNLSTCTT